MTDETDDILPMTRRGFLQRMVAAGVTASTSSPSLANAIFTTSEPSTEAVEALTIKGLQKIMSVAPSAELGFRQRYFSRYHDKHTEQASIFNTEATRYESPLATFLKDAGDYCDTLCRIKHIRQVEENIQQSAGDDYNIKDHIIAFQRSGAKGNALRRQVFCSETTPNAIRMPDDTDRTSLFMKTLYNIPTEFFPFENDNCEEIYKEEARHALAVIKNDGLEEVFPEAQSLFTDVWSDEASIEKLSQMSELCWARSELLQALEVTEWNLKVDEAVQAFSEHHLTNYDDFIAHKSELQETITKLTSPDEPESQATIDKRLESSPATEVTSKKEKSSSYSLTPVAEGVKKALDLPLPKEAKPESLPETSAIDTTLYEERVEEPKQLESPSH